MSTHSPHPRLFLIVASLLRIGQLDFSFPATDEFMASGYPHSGKSLLFLFFLSSLGWGDFCCECILVHLSCRPAARSGWCCCCVPFSAGSGICVLVHTGTDGIFWEEDVPCTLIPNQTSIVFRWVLEVQWGLCSRTQNVFYCSKSFMNISTVPIRCKCCETSWWEVMLYFHLRLAFWRFTPLNDVFSFCLLCFSKAFVVFYKRDLAKTISRSS